MTDPLFHGWSPLRLGLTVALALVSAFLLTELALGRLPHVPEGDGSDAWIAVVHCLMLAAIVAVYASARRLGGRSLEGLRRNFPNDGEALREPRRPPRTHLVVSALLGLVFIGVLTPYLTTPFPWRPSYWTPEVYWHRVLGPALGFMSGLTLYTIVRESLLVSAAASRLRDVVVLEPERFAPLVRHGLTNGLITVVILSVGGLFLLDPSQIRAVGPVLTIMVPAMAVGIILPVWGARSRIRLEKEREMRWAREGIRSAREQEPADTRRLGELSAYYEIMNDAPEWPFTQSAFLRAALYFLIPAGAWLGAVFLEALLQALVLSS